MQIMGSDKQGQADQDVVLKIVKTWQRCGPLYSMINKASQPSKFFAMPLTNEELANHSVTR